MRGEQSILDDASQTKLAAEYADIGLKDCLVYHWYNMPDGAEVAGMWDLRKNWHAYLGGFDFKGRRVLEFRPASGYLTFKMEAMGGRVVAFELPPGDAPELLPQPGMPWEELRKAHADNIRKIHNSWWFFHRELRSNAKVAYGDIYNLQSWLGRFDVSVFAAILLHLSNPFMALRQAAAITDQTIIVTDLYPGTLGERSVLQFSPTPGNPMAWWLISPPAVSQMLTAVGFPEQTITYHEHPLHKNWNKEAPISHRFYTIVASRTQPGRRVESSNNSPGIDLTNPQIGWSRALMHPYSFVVGNVEVPLLIPPAAQRPSAYVFSVHKAGSSLLQNIIMQLAAEAQLPVVDILDACFKVGAPEQELEPSHTRSIVLRDGYIFSIFRRLGSVPTEALAGRPKIFLVRDPRDMLVSLYFSLRYSHPLPGEGPQRNAVVQFRDRLHQIDINDFVLSDSAVVRNLREYIAAIDSSWRVYRYEDVIFNKRDWVADLAGYLDIEMPDSRLDEIAKNVDVIPEREDPYAHVRQVHPGNYRKHLSAATIKQLDTSLADILLRFGYS